MAWQDPPTTWLANMPIDTDQLQLIADDLRYLLKERVIANKVLNPSTTNVTGAGFASFADIDATNFKTSITPQSTRVRFMCHFIASRTAGTGVMRVDLICNSVRAGDATIGLTQVGDLTTNLTPFTVFGWFTGLTAGLTYDIKMQALLTVTTDNFRFTTGRSVLIHAWEA